MDHMTGYIGVVMDHIMYSRECATILQQKQEIVKDMLL